MVKVIFDNLNHKMLYFLQLNILIRFVAFNFSLRVKNNFNLIEKTANQILAVNGFSYISKARLATEEFPTRDYNGFVLEEGFYDALILELGVP
jgi:hypothetical protein